MWNVTLYEKTGMNSVNTVDHPNRLNNARSFNVPALDILQGEHLTSVKVKATRNQIKDVDFMALEDSETGDMFYYSVEGFSMTSKDVATLSIVFDAYLTLVGITNGIENVKFADGIVERHHVAKSSDTFGRYTEHDPYLIPSRELVMDIEYMFKLQYNTLSDNFDVIIESTIDLVAMADSTDAVTYTDEETGQSITAPNTRSVRTPTLVNIYNVQSAVTYITSGTAYFDFNNQKVREGIEKVRSLGIEGGILNAYIIPKMALHEATTKIVDGKYGQLHGEFLEQNSALRFEYANARNKRVLYGDLNSFELISISSGMSVTYKPEEIYHNGENSPTFSACFDPRPDGRPYFRSKWYRSVDTSAAVDGAFFANSVAGSEWANAPLAYTGKSGSKLDEIRYNTNRTIAYNDTAAQHDLTWRSLEESLKSSGGRMVGETIGSLMEGNIGSAFSTPITWFGQSRNAIEDQTIASNEINRRYKQNAFKELEEYLINRNVATPELHFPNSATLRDFIGNGLVICRKRLHDDDVEKCDRILDMYGYRDTTTITSDIFTNRSKFNFVKINGVSITGDIAKWIRELASAQFSAGVRIWHKLPDVNDYNGGNN